LTHDATTEALLDASHDVQDYWVIDAWSLITTVHRESTAVGYRSTVPVPQNQLLVPLLVPNLTLRLDQLGV
jgi:Uma2 family endonuclease